MKNLSILRTDPFKPVVPPKPANPFAEIGFWASPVTLEKISNSTRVYAVGTIRNLTNQQRFAVTVHLDVYDASGQRLNAEDKGPTDYQQVIEARGEWKFNAPVLDKKAASARLASITEN